MADCRAFHEYEELMDRVGAGEATDAERDHLLGHLDACPTCAESFAVIGGLRAERDTLAGDDAAPADFERLRRAVLRRIAAEERDVTQRTGFRALRFPHWQTALAATLAILLFAAGWRLGTQASHPSKLSRDATIPWLDAADAADATTAADTRTDFARQVRRVAAGHDRLEDSADSPYAYANVELRELGDGRYNLAFDVARHLELEVTADDPLLADVLVQSLVGGSPVGARLRAVALADSPLDGRVKAALVVAMRHDDNLGVRLAAQERLLAERGDGDVEAAMLAVLAAEEAVQMRLRAIDYLAGDRVPPERIERALAAAAGPVNRYVLARASAYLKSTATPSDTPATEIPTSDIPTSDIPTSDIPMGDVR